MILDIFYLRPDLGEPPLNIECDSYKTETHPVTGKLTVHTYVARGAAHALTGVHAGVSTVFVKRD